MGMAVYWQTIPDSRRATEAVIIACAFSSSLIHSDIQAFLLHFHGPDGVPAEVVLLSWTAPIVNV
jgi:hypothetical protein